MPDWLREWLGGFGKIVAVLALLAAVFGTPHLRWEWTCRHRLRSYGDPCSMYESCLYLGIQGWRRLYPEYREPCPFVHLLPIDWRALWPF